MTQPVHLISRLNKLNLDPAAYLHEWHELAVLIQVQGQAVAVQGIHLQ